MKFNTIKSNTPKKTQCSKDTSRIDVIPISTAWNTTQDDVDDAPRKNDPFNTRLITKRVGSRPIP